jgi:CAAX protease family protein
MSTPTVAARRVHTQSLVRRHPLIAFYVLTYAITWTLWAPLVIFPDQLPGPLAFVLLALGSNVPSVLGVLFVAHLRGRSGVVTLLRRLLHARIGLRWYLAVLALSMLAPLAIGVSILFGGATPVVGMTILSVLAFFLFSIFPGSALGEELGWRGFVLPRLQTRQSALKASLVIGILWGSWHLPLWLTGNESHPISLFVPFVIAVIALSVMYTWLYNNTGGSLFLVVLFHAASNLPITVLISPMGSRGAQPFLIYVALMVVAAAAIVIASGAEHLSRTAHRQIEQP